MGVLATRVPLPVVQGVLADPLQVLAPNPVAIAVHPAVPFGLLVQPNQKDELKAPDAYEPILNVTADLLGEVKTRSHPTATLPTVAVEEHLLPTTMGKLTVRAVVMPFTKPADVVQLRHACPFPMA